MAQADSLNNTSSRWWSLAQTLVWIILRIEMLPRDAEQIANSPGMDLEIKRALNELKREFGKAVLGMTEGMPIDKFRIPCGRHYVDLLTLIQLPRSAEPGALSAAMHELQEGVRWQDVECNPDWVKRAFPAPAPASVPVTNTESPVAEPEAASVDAMTAAAESRVEAEPAPAPPTEPPRVEPVSSSPELLLLPDEPQFEGLRKWQPEEVQAWFKNIRKTHPKKPGETNNAYARRLYEHMQNDFEEDIPWTEWTTLRRRLNDPLTEDD
jgi:hypothetical protein